MHRSRSAALSVRRRLGDQNRGWVELFTKPFTFYIASQCHCNYSIANLHSLSEITDSFFIFAFTILKFTLFKQTSCFQCWIFILACRKHSLTGDDYQFIHKSAIPSYHFQKSLRRLPIPKLPETCNVCLLFIQTRIRPTRETVTVCYYFWLNFESFTLVKASL